MRRAKQALSDNEIEEVLRTNSTGILSVFDGEYPYTVPLNYAYDNKRIYLHGALTGHKIDAIKHHDKVSFCIVDHDEVIPEKITTAYRSVIAFGQASICEDVDQRKQAFHLLLEKYCPTLSYQEQHDYIKHTESQTSVIIIDIDHITGKKGTQYQG